MGERAAPRAPQQRAAAVAAADGLPRQRVAIPGAASGGGGAERRVPGREAVSVPATLWPARDQQAPSKLHALRTCGRAPTPQMQLLSQRPRKSFPGRG
jgi:hypothetical protein